MLNISNNLHVAYIAINSLFEDTPILLLLNQHLTLGQLISVAVSGYLNRITTHIKTNYGGGGGLLLPPSTNRLDRSPSIKLDPEPSVATPSTLQEWGGGNSGLSNSCLSRHKQKKDTNFNSGKNKACTLYVKYIIKVYNHKE